ncbi:Methyl-CpG-binding domain protein 2-like protein [Dinothrombium tinctorium]|uniref:Methyl-CpG-binding domain protein 2-like protein n=1 Tax=Dinothrombium tinctorium TaxID=1965070 RepID=A0A3S3PLZ1_9ACAR|nr:Methyl-CpG-binding domain protein 2-like protein [Dinothrombium tinctorium]
MEARRSDAKVGPIVGQNRSVLHQARLAPFCRSLISLSLSPSGRRFKTKPQLARYLGDSVDLTTFDYRTGKINSNLLRKGKRQKGMYDYSRGIRSDFSLIPPIRQTASIFKQPVTVIKTQKDSKVRHDLKHGPHEKPKQLFWEKRLENLRAVNVDQEEYENFELPKNMKAVGPNVVEETALRSISTALHLHAQPITGQTAPKSNLEKNFGVYINPDQPLVESIVITDDDIKKQEEIVLQARKRLEETLNEISLNC